MRTLIVIAALVAFVDTYGEKVPGMIMLKESSRNVTFEIKVKLFDGEPNFERIQYKVRYYDETGKKQTLRPTDAEEIIFYYDGIEVRMVSCPNTIGGGMSGSSKIFLKMEIDGPLKLYRYYSTQTMMGTNAGGGGMYTPTYSYQMENMIFQKGDGPLKRGKTLGWKKDMLEYFNDCPGLRRLIESKELRKDDVEAIVDYYNLNCGRR